MKNATNNFRGNIFRNNTFILWLSAIVSWCLSRLVRMISLQTKLKLKELRELRERGTPELVSQIAIRDSMVSDLLNKGPSEDLYEALHESDDILSGIDQLGVLLDYIKELQDAYPVALISALEKAIAALELYSQRDYESDEPIVSEADKALAEIAGMLVGK